MGDKKTLHPRSRSYARILAEQYFKIPSGCISLALVALFALIGIYAPFFASSKPFFVIYKDSFYFPLFRYLFFSGFYNKPIDIFYNLLMFSLPMGFLAYFISFSYRKVATLLIICFHFLCFFFLMLFQVKDPASDPSLNIAKQAIIQKMRSYKGDDLSSNPSILSWKENLNYMTPYAKLNLLLRYKQRQDQDKIFQKKYAQNYLKSEKKEWIYQEINRKKKRLINEGLEEKSLPSHQELEAIVLKKLAKNVDVLAIPTLFRVQEKNLEKQISFLKSMPNSQKAQDKLALILDRKKWIQEELKHVAWVLMPLWSHFHWEDDAGGEQDINQFVKWYDLTRINRKDLLSALVFGIRISLIVGVLAILLQLVIGIPIGAIAGYFGGKVDIIVSRLLEIWEGLPTFFMLLMVVAILQNKSIFLVICVLGIFGWTGFSRFIRGEVLKQRNLPYVESCRAVGFGDMRILFHHILPNAIPPILTLLPFAIMGAMTSEAGLSFLGLGEEGSCSWGVLMDEGRLAFPGESYLLWPPATLLTVLLVSVALVGDALRDAFDPKLRRA